MNIENIEDKRLKVLDLYAGIGGASQAYLNRGDDVIRVENNHTILEQGYGVNTIFMNVENLDLTRPNLQGLDLIIAGIPCQDFSLGFNSMRSQYDREGRVWFPDLDNLKTTLHIIEVLKPKHFIIENVAGAIKYFKPYLGKYTQKIGSQVLWHNLPQFITVPASKLEYKKDLDKGGSHPLRMNHRACWPFYLSAASRDALLQKSLWDWGDKE